MKSSPRSALFPPLLAAAQTPTAIAQERLAGDTLQIFRTSGDIRVDGDLSVMFVGYGDDRVLSAQDSLEKVSRQLLVKLPYALQR